MERQLLTFAVALGALYLGTSFIKQRNTRTAAGWSEVADDIFAVRDAFGRYLRCENAAGDIIDDAKCYGCGQWGKATEFRPAFITGCPGDDEEGR